MNSQPAPLVNKSILVVLGGILVCLILLVVRAYRPEPAPPVPSMAENVTPPASGEFAPTEVSDVAPPTRPIPPRPLAKRTTRLAEVRLAPAPIDAGSVATPQASPDSPGLPLAQPGLVVGEPPVTEIVAPVAPVVAGSVQPQILGLVTLSGTPRPEVPIDLGPSCGRLQLDQPTTRNFVVGPKGELANVLVYLSAGVQTHSFKPPLSLPLLDQVGCMFEPYVMAVMTGQRFKIRNSDPELHNIHATPRVNREFNLAQGRRGQVTERAFDKPELFIRLKCDVHPWMFAYVSVLEHPFFAVTTTNGLYALPTGLPPGRYTVSAVHLKAGTQSQEVNLLDGEPKGLNFQFKVEPDTPPQRRVAEARP